MKRLFKYSDLPPSLQYEAVAKVARLAVDSARVHGEIWIESAAELARSATYSVTRFQGEITGLWNVAFPHVPKIMPGTERPVFQPATRHPQPATK